MVGLLLATLEVPGVPRADIRPLEIPDEDPLEVHPVADAVVREEFKPCPNHAYSIKHLYKECELLKRFLRQAGGPKEGDGKDLAAKRGGTTGEDRDGFPEPEECIMIFGGSDVIWTER